MYSYDYHTDGNIIPEIEDYMEKDDFILSKEQKLNIKRLIYIISKYGFCFDKSKMGLGKSVVACYVSLILNKSLCVICPKEAFNVFVELKEHFNNIKMVITKESLSGSISNLAKNGLVKGYIVEGAKGKKYVNYVEDKLLLKLINRGYMFLIDEAHMCKNDSNINRAISCISSNVIRNFKNKDSSVVMFTTASLTDKLDLSPIYNFLGFLPERKLIVKYPFRNYDGINNVINYCKKLDKETLSHIITLKMSLGSFDNINEKKLNGIASDIFSRIFVPYFFSHIEDDIPSEYEPNIFNVFHKLNTKKGLDKILDELKQLFIENQNNKVNSLTLYKNSLDNLEKALLPVFVGMALDDLESNEDDKIILCFNRTSSVDYCLEFFTDLDYRVIKITGKESNFKSELVKKFQRNDNKYRIIVCTTASIKQSISLDDRYGNHKRKMYISPNHNCLDMTQIMGRIFRKLTTKSKGDIFYVYGLPNDFVNVNNNEGSILNFSLYQTIHFKIIKILSEKEKQLKTVSDINLLPTELPYIFNDIPIYPKN